MNVRIHAENNQVLKWMEIGEELRLQQGYKAIHSNPMQIVSQNFLFYFLTWFIF